MSLFTTADLHLSLGSSKPMDIFKGWENSQQRIKKNWNETVKSEDTVVIIGDVSWAMKLSDAILDFTFINDLNGNKIIIKGNHDYWWTTVKKMEEFLCQNNLSTIKILNNNCYEVGKFFIAGSRGWFYDAPKEDEKTLLREAGRIRASIESAEKMNTENEQQKEIIVFLHYPPIYNNYECEEILNVLLEKNIKTCYYGHIHGEGAKWALNSQKHGINFKLVSCDTTNFTPIIIL